MISILLRWLLSLFSLVIGSEETGLDAPQGERDETEKWTKVDSDCRLTLRTVSLRNDTMQTMCCCYYEEVKTLRY